MFPSATYLNIFFFSQFVFQLDFPMIIIQDNGARRDDIYSIFRLFVFLNPKPKQQQNIFDRIIIMITTFTFLEKKTKQTKLLICCDMMCYSIQFFNSNNKKLILERLIFEIRNRTKKHQTSNVRVNIE